MHYAIFHAMKKIGVKYCGGCNPSYERVEIVHRAQSHLNHPFHFVHHDQPDIDAMLLMNGCQRACALQDLNRTVTHFSVTGENDFEALMGWLKSLSPKETVSYLAVRPSTCSGRTAK
jgi:hypothetical protein